MTNAMLIKKQEKTLQDRFGRQHDYLRLSITDRCNLRCVYCMPEEGLPFFPHEKVLSATEIITLVKHFAKMGIKKVRLTGGEPLLRKDILEIAAGIKAIDEIEDLSVTTNGLALPRMAADLKKAGVDRLNISLDTFDAKKYHQMTRGGKLEKVLAGIDAASQQGFKAIKLNTVVINGQNQTELRDFLRYTITQPVNVRFIEFMPIASQKKNWTQGYAGVKEVFTICQTEGWAYEKLTLSGNGPSENYQIKGAKGSFGLIHPVSCQFCESCNRLRVTADGCLKSCLYWADEINLRNKLDDAAAFEATVVTALNDKPENHQMALDEQEKVKERQPTWRHMSQIGG